MKKSDEVDPIEDAEYEDDLSEIEDTDDEINESLENNLDDVHPLLLYG